MNAPHFRQEILALESSLWQAVTNRDSETLANLFADDYVEITLNGSRVTRNAIVTESPLVDELESWAITDEECVQIAPNVVLLSYHLTLHGQCRGLPIAPPDRWATSVWRKNRNTWQRVLFQQSRYAGQRHKLQPSDETPAIRTMEFDDLNDVIKLWEQSEGVFLSDSDTLPALQNYLRHNGFMSYVAVADDRIVGAILCGHDGRRGYLHHLAVAASHRRQGIGGQLVEYCSGRLLAEGINRFNLFLLDNNFIGRTFWEDLKCEAWDQCRILSKTIESD